MDLLLLSSRQNSADTSALAPQWLILHARQTARNEQDGRQHQSIGGQSFPLGKSFSTLCFQVAVRNQFILTKKPKRICRSQFLSMTSRNSWNHWKWLRVFPSGSLILLTLKSLLLTYSHHCLCSRGISGFGVLLPHPSSSFFFFFFFKQKKKPKPERLKDSLKVTEWVCIKFEVKYSSFESRCWNLAELGVNAPSHPSSWVTLPLRVSVSPSSKWGSLECLT